MSGKNNKDAGETYAFLTQPFYLELQTKCWEPLFKLLGFFVNEVLKRLEINNIIFCVTCKNYFSKHNLELRQEN